MPIVHLASNMVRDTILCRTDAGPFLFRQYTIGHCPVFHRILLSSRLTLELQGAGLARAYLYRKKCVGVQMTKKIWQGASP